MAWPKGKKHTASEKKKIRKSIIKYWSNPSARLRMSRIMLKQRKKLSLIKIKQYEDIKLRKKIDKTITKWWREHPDARKKKSLEVKQFFISNPKAFAEFVRHGKNPLKRHLRTKSGYFVRSRGEKQIADFLFSLKIPFFYEEYSLFFRHGRFAGNLCTPDFFLPKLNIFIEFYGGYPAAWKKKVLKNKIYAVNKIPVLGITPAELDDLDYYLIKDAEKLSRTGIAKKFKIVEWR